MASSSSIHSSSLSRNWEYDVFVSFHGKDVRRFVLSHILKEFKIKGINPFIDNEIKRGKFIGSELKKAIHGSRIAIALLSKRYASSSWCLDELVEIMKCKEELGQTVITIFYEVNPTDVKKQTGDFGKVFEKTCVGKTKVVIEKWILALAEVATIAGYHSRNWVDDAAMIDVITADILKKLFNFTPSSDFNRFIGMRAHLIRMEPLLRLDLEDVRMIGIWGPSGIGKTTIARCLFSEFSSRYQLSAFVENIKEPPCSDYYGALLYLQQQFISQITNQKDFKISHLGVAQDRLKGKKVLVVLDNVTESVQLDAMAEKNECFGSGSRVIITTQDRSLLRKRKIPFYKVDYPTSEEAFQIFCMYAFKQNFPYDDFEELSQEVTRLSGDLPLGLQVIGSYFYGMPKEEWMKNLPRLRTQLNGKIESKLKFSYDALFDVDKELFLYIACLFNNRHKEKVEGCLAKSIRNVSQGLQVLADKSLISISDYGDIEMHDLLVQLGEEIVRKQSILEPGKRQFLVDPGDVCKVLTDDKTIAGSVIGIKYECWKDIDEDMLDSNISGRALEGVTNLQFLRLRGGSFRPCEDEELILTSMPRCLNNRSPKLRLIEWMNSWMTRFPFLRLRLTPMKYICNISAKLRVIEWKHSRITRFPFTELECLVYLDMSDSSGLQKLWGGNKPLPNLKWMDMSNCYSLKEIPDLSTATSLRKLNLSLCSRLKELPSSIGNATSLEELNLRYCSSLEKLPSTIENLHKLSDLNLEGCSTLEALHTNINLKSLITLNLSHCSMWKTFPGISINIENLYLGGTAIKEWPSSIKVFPHAFNSIIKLVLTNTELQELGPWIKRFPRLRQLVLNRMPKLVSIPQLPDSLLFLDAENCRSLERLDCSFCNPEISLNFHNCFELNQAARDLIIRTSTRGLVVLPGVEVPAYFTNRDSQSSVIVKLNQKSLRTSTDLKACILADSPYTCILSDTNGWHWGTANCSITSKENARPIHVQDLKPMSSDHLYIFQFGVKEVTSIELEFNFWLKNEGYFVDSWNILECGVLQLLEFYDENYEK